ncbi:Peptidase c48, partial [Thalictrum thalictroides]
AIGNLKQYGAFRSCPTSMVSITTNMKETLLSSHKEAMLNTPFGRFFNLFLDKKIKKESMANQNRNLLFDIISRYSVENDAFKFGEGENAKFVKFEPKHVALTFGIPVYGRKIAEVFRKFRFDPDQSSFLVKHNLQACGDIKRDVMKSNIESLMTAEGSEKDFCRMIILFMSATIFFPNSNNSIGKSFVVHLENIDNMKKLGWADLIYRELMKKIKVQKENPLYCACVIPLLVWFCEITGVMEPRKGYIDGTPRIGKWNFSKLSDVCKKDFIQNIAMDKVYLCKN